MQEHFKGHPPSGGSSSKEHSVHDKGKPGTTQEAALAASQQAEGRMDALREGPERLGRDAPGTGKWARRGQLRGPDTHSTNLAHAHVWCKAGSCC